MTKAHEEVETVLMQTEDLLSDILLSGFQNVHDATLEHLHQLKKTYDSYGMDQGASLALTLHNELLKRKNSFSYDLENLMRAYSQMMFYIDTLIE